MKDKILQNDMRSYDGRERFKNLFNVLEASKEQSLTYQKKYGSSDNDASEKAYYDKIIENNLCLY